MTEPAAGTDRHLPILLVLVRLWGGLSILIGVSMLLLSLGAVAIVLDATWPRDAFGAEFTVGALAAVFGVLGAFAVVWGGLHLWAAALLGRYRSIGRLLTLGLSVVNLLVLPFGTALGLYGLWLLMTHDARVRFESNSPR